MADWADLPWGKQMDRTESPSVLNFCDSLNSGSSYAAESLPAGRRFS